ncbi:uncharacterized protein LOC117611566 [Osmia lignaria lignaria]|uniref:uncharacterized protein LOC117611566 n=1 Tax=Osmia lignaria lignaria TaxID=1437193 RepID=UPI001479068A|nr:uncharacterized protein LOC117611566 [Osmia lignaria]
MKGLFFITIAVYLAYVVYGQAPTVNCPPYDQNSDGPLLVPHPCNCSAYYVCFSPVNIPMPCPVGLQFNNATKKCDWPWIVKCRPQINCPGAKIQDAVESHEELSREEEVVIQEEQGEVSREQVGKLSAAFFH